MANLFGRAWALQVGAAGRAREYTGMDIAATVNGSKTPGSSGAKITLWMPAGEMVSALGAADAFVRLLAGYREGGAVELVQGRVVASSLRDQRGGRDPLVEFQISPRSVVTAPVSLHLDGPIAASAVIEAVRAQVGIPAGSIVLGDDIEIARGYSASGRPLRIFQDLAESTGSVLDLDDGVLSMRPTGQPKATTADLWTSSSGLTEVSGPSGDSEIRATALLRPATRVGSLIRLADPAYRGDVVVREYTHELDNRGGRWHTSIVGVARRG